MGDRLYRLSQDGEWEIIGEVSGLPVWISTSVTSVTISIQLSDEMFREMQLTMCGRTFVQHIPFDFGDDE